MNYIYAIAHEEKETLEKVKKYIGIAALPFAISGGGFCKSFTDFHKLGFLSL